jgi:hypothetical protein
MFCALRYLRPFLCDRLHEVAQGMHDVVDVDLGTPGQGVSASQPFVLKEGGQHLLVQLEGTLAWMGLVSFPYPLLR